MMTMSKFQKEIAEEIECIAKECGCKKESLEYMVFEHENGYCILTAEGFKRLGARAKNKLLKGKRKVEKKAV
jgi:hypothetical protein